MERRTSSFVGSILTAAGVLVLLGFAGGVAKTVEVWSTPQTRCLAEGQPSVENLCVRDVPVTGLAKVPWAYLGLSVGLFLLAVGIFTLRELIRPES